MLKIIRHAFVQLQIQHDFNRTYSIAFKQLDWCGVVFVTWFVLLHVVRSLDWNRLHVALEAVRCQTELTQRRRKDQLGAAGGHTAVDGHRCNAARLAVVGVVQYGQVGLGKQNSPSRRFGKQFCSGRAFATNSQWKNIH